MYVEKSRIEQIKGGTAVAFRTEAGCIPEI